MHLRKDPLVDGSKKRELSAAPQGAQVDQHPENKTSVALQKIDVAFGVHPIVTRVLETDAQEVVTEVSWWSAVVL